MRMQSGSIRRPLPPIQEYVAARNNLALVYFTADKIQLGLEQLEEAIKIDPRHPMLFRNLAIVYNLLSDFAAAERAARQAIDQAIDLDRSDVSTRMILGLALIEQRKFTEEALRCFERAFHQFALAHLLAGQVLLGQGEMNKGKTEIREYLATGDRARRDLAIKWLDLLDHAKMEIPSAESAAPVK